MGQTSRHQPYEWPATGELLPEPSIFLPSITLLQTFSPPGHPFSELPLTLSQLSFFQVILFQAENWPVIKQLLTRPSISSDFRYLPNNFPLSRSFLRLISDDLSLTYSSPSHFLPCIPVKLVHSRLATRITPVPFSPLFLTSPANCYLFPIPSSSSIFLTQKNEGTQQFPRLFNITASACTSLFHPPQYWGNSLPDPLSFAYFL